MNRKIMYIIIGLFLIAGISFANTIIINNQTALSLPNTIVLNNGQKSNFLNGSIKIANESTIYQAPNVGNIHAYATANWIATTYVTINNTFPYPIFINNVYFSAVNKNPNNINIYEQETQLDLVNTTNTISFPGLQTYTCPENSIIVANIANAPNPTYSCDFTRFGNQPIITFGNYLLSSPTISINAVNFSIINRFNATQPYVFTYLGINTISITYPVPQNITFWQNLSGSQQLILGKGLNYFKIIGKGKPGQEYDWDYEFTTANAAAPTLSIPTNSYVYSSNPNINGNSSILSLAGLPSSISINDNLIIGNSTINSSLLSTYILTKIITKPATSINIDPAWHIPTGVVAWFNITIKNPDPTNTLYQYNALPIGINGIAFNNYMNGCATNMVIFNGITGNIPYQWLEGNVANDIQTCTSNPFNAVGGELVQGTTNALNGNLLVWIKTDQTLTAALSVANAYALGFLSFSTNTMNGNNIGESPILSCASGASPGTCGTYAKYDTGANVFSILYQNFEGTSAPTGWNQHAANIVVDNGLTWTTASLTDYMLTSASYGLVGNQIFDIYANPGTTTSSGSYILGYQNTADTAFVGLSAGGENPASSWVGDNGVFTQFRVGDTLGVNNIYTTYFSALNRETFYLNYVPTASNTFGGPTTAEPVGMDNIASGGGAVSGGDVLWTRIRNYIPVNLIESNGVVQTAYMTPTTPMLTLSNTFIDQGQTILFSANIVSTQGTPTYSFAYNVYTTNSAGITLIANQLYTGNTYTSNTWAWTPSGDLYVGNTLFFANVIVYDSHVTSVNSVSESFGYNSVFLVGTATESNSIIDIGQDTLQTANPSQGTQPYVNYQWYTIAGSTAPGCTAQNTITSATSSTYLGAPTTTNSYAYKVSDSASLAANTACSSGDTVTVNAMPTANAILSNTLLDSGQTVTITLQTSGGRSPFTANLVNVTGSIKQGAANVLVFTIAGSNAISFTALTSTNNNQFTYVYNAIDYGTTTNDPFNSIYNTITVNTVLMTTGTPLPSSPKIDLGQQISLTASAATGGTQPYSYQWYSNYGSSVTCSGAGNAISGAITLSPSAFGPTTINSYAVLVTDDATTAVTQCSSGDTVTVNGALSGTSITASNALADQGQWETMTFIWSGGTPNYNSNIIAANSADAHPIIANAITGFSIGASPSTFTFQLPMSNNDLGTIKASGNVLDGSSVGATNGLILGSFSVNMPLSSISLTPPTASFIIGNTQVLTGSISGGTSPYTYNYIISNSMGRVFNALYVANAYTTNTFTFTPLAVGIYNANLVISDSATTNEILASTNSIITVVSGPNGPNSIIISPNLITIDRYQTQTYTAGWINGVLPFTVNWIEYQGTAIISNQLIKNVNTRSSTFTINGTIVGTYYVNVIVTDASPITVNTTSAILTVVGSVGNTGGGSGGGGGGDATNSTIPQNIIVVPKVDTTSTLSQIQQTLDSTIYGIPVWGIVIIFAILSVGIIMIYSKKQK